MRKVCYRVAASLDGYIAGPNGEINWIVNDPSIDFGALTRQFGTMLVGRRTFEEMMKATNPPLMGMKMYVFSRTLPEKPAPKNATIVRENHTDFLRTLRAQPGKDIWILGGGALFGSLLREGLVDNVEVAVMPVLLGGGVPLVSALPEFAKLQLESHKIYPTGIVSLSYTVVR